MRYPGLSETWNSRGRWHDCPEAPTDLSQNAAIAECKQLQREGLSSEYRVIERVERVVFEETKKKTS